MKYNNQNAKNSKAQAQDRDAIREFRAETSEIAGVETAVSTARRREEEVKNRLKNRFRANDDWVFISDYHTDFYQLAVDPQIYGYNIECEVWVGNLKGGTRLPWIDIYAGQEESDDDGQATKTASGFEGGNQPSNDAGSLVVVEAKDGAPKIVFKPAIDERHVNVCYPQKGRLFGKKVRECARAWAKLNGYSIPLERVVVCTNRAFADDEAIDEAAFFGEFVKLNPELAVEWGLATEEELFPRLAAEACRREEASRIPQIKGVTVAPEVLERMRQNMSPEQFAQTLAWIESTNAADAQNAENQEEDAE